MSAQPPPHYRQEPKAVLAAWLADALTWESFQSVSDDEMAETMLDALKQAGYMVVTVFEPDNHHNAALCPYCTPRPTDQNAQTGGAS